MADNETIADIRKETEARFRELVEAWMKRRSTFQTTVGAMQAFNNVFDRLEAAHKREAVTGSNQLREALKHIKDRLPHMLQYMRVHWEDASAGGYFDELMLVIDAALAAPATAEKSSAVGDAAKLREALEFCVKGMCGFCRMDAEARGMTTKCVHGCEALLKAKAALAEPPRNCDIVPIEAREAAEIFHRERPCHGYCYETHDWLLAPATEQEGGNDGNE